MGVGGHTLIAQKGQAAIMYAKFSQTRRRANKIELCDVRMKGRQKRSTIENDNWGLDLNAIMSNDRI